jgi:chromosome segregation ATPase
MPGDPSSFGSQLKGEINHKLDEAGLSQNDYIKAALSWQYNWIGLAGAAAFAVVSGTGLPIVLAAGVELMYVALVPQSSRFRRLVRSWKYAAEKRDHQKKLDEMYRNLPQEMGGRYKTVQQIVEGIRANYQMLSATSQVFARQMEERLAGLLEGYVRLLFAANTHREYLKTLTPDRVKKEIAALEKGLENDQPKVRDINRGRIDILRKRLAKFEKIAENREVIDAQCAAIEDVLQLIRDQSVTMRDPQEVSAQLENLVQDVEQTEQNVREMEEIFAMTAPESDELRLPDPGGDAPQRNRIRS